MRVVQECDDIIGYRGAPVTNAFHKAGEERMIVGTRQELCPRTGDVKSTRKTTVAHPERNQETRTNHPEERIQDGTAIWIMERARENLCETTMLQGDGSPAQQQRHKLVPKIAMDIEVVAVGRLVPRAQSLDAQLTCVPIAQSVEQRSELFMF